MFVNLKELPIVLLLLSQMWGLAFSGRTTKRPPGKSPAVGGGNPSMEKIISERIKATPKAQMAQYKTQAAKRLQTNLAKMIQALTRNDKRIPTNVRNSAKTVLKNLKAGQYTPPLTNALPGLLTQIPQQQGNAGGQLGTTLQGIQQYSPQGSTSGGPLQVLLTFVKENLNAVNDLLGGTLVGVPNLLQGVVGSLIGSLGAVSNTVGGSLDAVGALLGGLLSG